MPNDNVDWQGAVPLHSKVPIREEENDPEKSKKRCWLIIKTITVLVFLLLSLIILVVVLVGE